MASLNHRDILRKLSAEKRRLAIFITVGSSSLALSIALYALLSRVIWPSGPRILQNALVVLLVTAVNFEANRHFTFTHRRTAGAAFRFGVVAICAMALNNLLFWIGHSVLGLYDLFVIVGVTCMVALFTYSSHRLFTFHDDPWRHARRLRPLQ